MKALAIVTGLAVMMALAAPAMAADVTWTGDTSTDFNDGNNWSDDTLPVKYVSGASANGDIAVFDGSTTPSNKTPTLTADFGSVDPGDSSKMYDGLLGMEFADDGWTLDTGATDNTGPALYLSYRASAAIDSQATSGVNTINGYLRFEVHNTNAGPTIDVASGGTLRINGIADTLEDYNGTNTNNAIYVDGGGTLELNLGGGNTTRLGSRGWEVLGGSTVEVFAETAGGWTGDGTAGLGSQNNRQLTVTDGVWDMNGANSNFKINNISLAADGVFTNTDGANAVFVTTKLGSGTETIAGTIEGNLGIQWQANATATVELSTAHTYTGDTKIRANGKIKPDVLTPEKNMYVIVKADALVSTDGPLGNSASTVDLGANSLGGAWLLTDGDVEIARDILVNTKVNDSSAACFIGAADTQTASSEFSGEIAVGQNVNSVLGITAPAAATVNVTGDIVEDGGGTEGTVYKVGDGVVVLSGSNTYAGGTSVEAGTLLVNSGAGSGAVDVKEGATLGGTGTITGAVTVAGGTMAPGASTGALTVNNAVELTNDGAGTSSTFEVEIAGLTDYDQLVSDNTVTLTDVDLSVTLDEYTPDVGDTFTIIDGTVSGTFNGLAEGDTFDVDSTTFKITYAASAELEVIPEPATAAVLCLGGALLAMRRRRR